MGLRRAAADLSRRLDHEVGPPVRVVRYEREPQALRPLLRRGREVRQQHRPGVHLPPLPVRQHIHGLDGELKDRATAGLGVADLDLPDERQPRRNRTRDLGGISQNPGFRGSEPRRHRPPQRRGHLHVPLVDLGIAPENDGLAVGEDRQEVVVWVEEQVRCGEGVLALAGAALVVVAHDSGGTVRDATPRLQPEQRRVDRAEVGHD